MGSRINLRQVSRSAHDSGAAARLRFVEGLIGALDRSVDALLRAPFGDPATHPQFEEDLLVERQWLTCEGRRESLTDSLGIACARIGKQDDELVTACARDNVAMPDAGADQRGEVDQRAIAGIVTELVIDLLEAINVEHRDGQLAVGLDRVDPCVERFAIEQSG